MKHGELRRIAILCLLSLFVFTFSLWRRRRFAKHGYNGRAYDIKLSVQHDILTQKGFQALLEACLEPPASKFEKVECG